MNKFSIRFSTFFGLGYFPYAPGTFATLFIALVYYFLLPEYLFYPFNSAIWFGVFLIVFCIIAAPIVTIAELNLGKDNGKIIIDEIIGYFISVLFIPKSLLVAVAGFVFFRFFDIFKPEPVNICQKIKGGWGVIIDDIMAAIYANIAVRILIKIL